MADEFEEIGYPYTPNPFRARLQSCTGKEFCKFGITETKEFAKKVVVELENRFPGTGSWRLPRKLPSSAIHP